ncbi:MAG: zinc ribbon domain-containing protein [Euryarchaeota archaeon]|nr:zinc ribbon domain-containing protein [Euryarchaeota archaeon]
MRISKTRALETEPNDIATSGIGVTKLLAIRNRRFPVVSWTNCGSSESYKGSVKHDPEDSFSAGLPSRSTRRNR